MVLISEFLEEDVWKNSKRACKKNNKWDNPRRTMILGQSEVGKPRVSLVLRQMTRRERWRKIYCI